MKRFLPFFILIFVFAFFLGGQIVYQSIANLVQDYDQTRDSLNSVEKKFNESILQNMVLEQAKDLSQIPIIILQFWAPWCSQCISEFPALVNLQKKFDQSELLIISFRSDSDNGDYEANKIMQRYNINFPVVKDRNGNYFQEFNISAIPTTMIFFYGKLLEVTNGPKSYDTEEQIERFENLVNQSK